VLAAVIARDPIAQLSRKQPLGQVVSGDSLMLQRTSFLQRIDEEAQQLVCVLLPPAD
jgi:hypothetical protein